MSWKDNPITPNQLVRIEEYQRVFDIELIVNKWTKGLAGDVISSFVKYNNPHIDPWGSKDLIRFLDSNKMVIRDTDVSFKHGCVLPDIPEYVDKELTDKERRAAQEQFEIDLYSNINYDLDHPDGFDPDTFCIMPH